MAKCDHMDYSFSRGWYCKITDETVDDDIMDRYCECGRYAYEDCPIYEEAERDYRKYGTTGSSSSSGCFITTSCVEMQSLEDDCRELTVLRAFRDGYMKEQACGEADIKEYYDIAPRLIEQIDASGVRETVYNNIYNDVIVPCVELIESGHNEEAYNIYKSMVLGLKFQYME